MKLFLSLILIFNTVTTFADDSSRLMSTEEFKRFVIANKVGRVYPHPASLPNFSHGMQNEYSGEFLDRLGIKNGNACNAYGFFQVGNKASRERYKYLYGTKGLYYPDNVSEFISEIQVLDLVTAEIVFGMANVFLRTNGANINGRDLVLSDDSSIYIQDGAKGTKEISATKSFEVNDANFNKVNMNLRIIAEIDSEFIVLSFQVFEVQDSGEDVEIANCLII